jgi:peptidoglycan/LPS O-acetylase OafA/YrhL
MFRTEAVAVAPVGSREPSETTVYPANQHPRTRRTAQRVESIDFVKGALVLLMVLYHWLNYFIGLQWEGYRYLRFLTPSFIFITGFLTSQVYLRKYAASDPQLRRRLWTRGLKLLSIFIALNVLIELSIGGRLHLTTWDRPAAVFGLEAIFVHATPLAAFDILVSIAYFLLLCPLVLMIAARLKVSAAAVSAALAAGVLLASVSVDINTHIEMLSFGLLGVVTGRVSIDRIDDVVGRSRIVILAAYLLYIAAITALGAIYPLLLLGVCLTVLVIYMFAALRQTNGVFSQRVVRMGQYSLFAYIAQIAVLQLLRRVFAAGDLPGAALGSLLVIAVGGTVASVELAALLRRRSSLCDRLYRLAFA